MARWRSPHLHACLQKNRCCRRTKATWSAQFLDTRPRLRAAYFWAAYFLRIAAPSSRLGSLAVVSRIHTQNDSAQWSVRWSGTDFLAADRSRTTTLAHRGSYNYQPEGLLLHGDGPRRIACRHYSTLDNISYPSWRGSALASAVSLSALTSVQYSIYYYLVASLSFTVLPVYCVPYSCTPTTRRRDTPHAQLRGKLGKMAISG
jgi:hypothetical protein